MSLGSKPLRCLGGEDMVVAALVPFEIASGLALVLLLPMEVQLLTVMCSEASGGGEGGSWAGTRWPDAEIARSELEAEVGWYGQAGGGGAGSPITRVRSPWPTSLFGTAFSSCLLTLPAPGPPIQILDYRPFTPPLSLCLRGCSCRELLSHTRPRFVPIFSFLSLSLSLSLSMFFSPSLLFFLLLLLVGSSWSGESLVYRLLGPSISYFFRFLCFLRTIRSWSNRRPMSCRRGTFDKDEDNSAVLDPPDLVHARYRSLG